MDQQVQVDAVELMQCSSPPGGDTAVMVSLPLGVEMVEQSQSEVTSDGLLTLKLEHSTDDDGGTW